MILRVSTCIGVLVIPTNNPNLVNVVFEEKEEASNALKSLTKDSETELDVLTERDAFQFDKAKPDVEFTIRMSKISDKKVKRAAQYSRYYLMNPEEEKKFKMAKYVSRSFRDREPLGRKSRILSDDEDEIDLFPQRANEEAVIRDSQWTTSEMNSTPLSERVSISESNPLSERLGDLDDDDLFKR